MNDNEQHSEILSINVKMMEINVCVFSCHSHGSQSISGARTGGAGRTYLMVARQNEGEHEHRGKRGIAAESQPPVVFMAQHRSFAENRSYSLCVCVCFYERDQHLPS